MFVQLFEETIKDIWPILLMFIVTLTVIRFYYLKNSRQRTCFYKETLDLLFILYILILFTFLSKTDINIIRGFNFIPFAEITRYAVGSKLFAFNILGNIVAFLPFGLYIAYHIKPKTIFTVFTATLIVSFSVELIQYNIGRAFDIDDVILNVLGSSIGYLIFVGLNAVKCRLPKIFQKDGLYDVLCIIIIFTLIAYILGFMGVININELL